MSAEVQYVGAIWECVECHEGGGIGDAFDIEVDADEHNAKHHTPTERSKPA